MRSKGMFFFAIAVIALVILPLVSANEYLLHPTSGDDTTPSPHPLHHILTSSDLTHISSSNNVWYRNNGSWYADYQNTEYIEYVFSPQLEVCNILSTKVKVEWHTNSRVDEARILVYADGVWKPLVLGRAVDEDDTVIFDVTSDVNTLGEINNFKLRFQAKDDENSNNAWSYNDLIEFQVVCDEEVPDTNVTYATKDDGSDPRYCEWNGEEEIWEAFVNFGSNNIVVNGISQDTSSNLADIAWVRGWESILDSWDDYWQRAQYASGNSKQKEWSTSRYADDWPANEFVKVCGSAVDTANNKENGMVVGRTVNVQTLPEDDCCWLCIDRINPSQPGTPFLENPSQCVPEYINENPVFSWAPSTDDPECSGIDHYEVEIYNSDGSLYYIVNRTTTSVVIDGQNGHDYYVRVRAWDMANNNGTWSEYSDEVYVDTEDPIVTINSPTQGTYFRYDFEVSETDEDENLWKCFYKVANNGSQTLDWTEITCNENVSIDVSEYCLVDGTCRIYKQAVDKACNDDDTSKYYYVDRTSPITTKTVGEPKYPGFFWMEWLIDWFITDITTISFDCYDAGVGCNGTFYRINSGDWLVYEGPFSLSPDGVYFLEYYSIDALENTEAVKNETDKVDTEPPITTKTYGYPEFLGWRTIPEFDLNVWMRFITSQTPITLDDYDTEVGVNETWWTLLIPDQEGWVWEWYGQDTQEWYECDEECYLENEICNFTTWMPKIEYMEEFCPIEHRRYSPYIKTIWCNYIEPVSIYQDCDHKICYYSFDHLMNTEEMHCQVFSVDNQPPVINIENPFSPVGCTMLTFDVLAEITDEKSGVNETGVFARVVDQTDWIPMEHIGNRWRASMDNDLLAGNYTIEVKAYDNLGNYNVATKEVAFYEDVYWEIAPDHCTLDWREGGECTFTYRVNLCHGGDQVAMIMEKLCGLTWLNPRLYNGTHMVYVAEIFEIPEYFWFGSRLHSEFPPIWVGMDGVNEWNFIKVADLDEDHWGWINLSFTLPVLRSAGMCDELFYFVKPGYSEPVNTTIYPRLSYFSVDWYDTMVSFYPREPRYHECGDGVVDPDEQCDGTNFAGQTCSDFGDTNGELSCTQACMVDTSGCYTPEEPEPPRGGSSGGGGGGGSGGSSGSCQENWDCSLWSDCIGGTNLQYRLCTDLNKCGTITNKPAITQSCSTAEANGDSETGSSITEDGLTGAVVGTGSTKLVGGLIAFGIIAIALILSLVVRKFKK
ncbi:MAG: fibronectin type III domain-containing protein [archaeon]